MAKNHHTGWNLVEWTKTGGIESNGPKLGTRQNRGVIHTSYLIGMENSGHFEQIKMEFKTMLSLHVTKFKLNKSFNKHIESHVHE